MRIRRIGALGRCAERAGLRQFRELVFDALARPNVVSLRMAVAWRFARRMLASSTSCIWRKAAMCCQKRRRPGFPDRNESGNWEREAST